MSDVIGRRFILSKPGSVLTSNSERARGSSTRGGSLLTDGPLEGKCRFEYRNHFEAYGLLSEGDRVLRSGVRGDGIAEKKEISGGIVPDFHTIRKRWQPSMNMSVPKGRVRASGRAMKFQSRNSKRSEHPGRSARKASSDRGGEPRHRGSSKPPGPSPDEGGKEIK